MKALAIAGRDIAPELMDVAERDPGPGEVRVSVEAASINGFDLAVAAGRIWGSMRHEFPVVLGRDFAGTVEALGADVTELAVGDRVASTIHAGLGPGALAERVTQAASTLAKVPASLSSIDAAAVPLAGVAALDVLDAAQVGTGDVVLISGATGGVGVLAVQLAAQRGARVIATAQPGAEADTIMSFGAAQSVDHTGDLAAQVRAIAPDGVDAAVHAAGDPAQLGSMLRPGGRLASLLGAGSDAVGRDDVTVVAVQSRATAEKIAGLLTEVAAGRLTVPVAETYPLDKATDALGAFTGSKIGKIVVTV